MADNPSDELKKPESTLTASRIEPLPASGFQKFALKFDDEADEKDPLGVQTLAFELPVDHDGATAYIKGWVQPNDEQRPIIFIHDFGENLTYYREAAKEVVERGRTVFCYDVRGHGRSGRMLGHFNSFDELVNDLLQIIAWVKHRSKGQAPYIIGHGVGSLIGLSFVLKYPSYVHGLVLSAPAFELQGTVSPSVKLMIRSLADIMPRVRLPASISPRFVMHPSSPSEGSVIHSLKTTHFPRVTVQFANELLKAVDLAPGKFLRLKQPALLLWPEDDEICSDDVVQKLISRHKNRDLVEYKRIASAGHNLFTNQPVILEQVLDEIFKWIALRDQSPN